MFRPLLYVALALLCATASAASDLRQQYAYGAMIHSDSSGPVLSVAVTQQVYQGVYYPDLRDITVINNSGHEVPFLLRAGEGADTQTSSDYTLPFFPLHLDSAEALKQIQVTTHADGSIINIEQHHSATEEGKNLYYLIDASGIAQGDVVQLTLQWQQTESVQLIEARLEGSNDLQHWQAIATPVFSHMSYSGFKLDKQTAWLPANSRYQYYRLTWPPGEEARIDTIQMSVQGNKAKLATPQSLNLEPKTATSNSYVYDAGGFLPISTVRVIPSEDNSVAEVQLYSRNHEDEQWQLRGSSTSFRLQLQARKLDSDPIHVTAQAARYWKVVVVSKKNYFNHPPQLQVQWHGQQLFFLAQGDAPYQLLYGRSQQQGQGRDALLQNVLQLAQQTDSAEPPLASLGPRQVLCGVDCLQPQTTPISWTRYILWAIILIGVAGLTWMAVALYRELNRTQS